MHALYPLVILMYKSIIYLALSPKCSTRIIGFLAYEDHDCGTCLNVGQQPALCREHRFRQAFELSVLRRENFLVLLFFDYGILWYISPSWCTHHARKCQEPKHDGDFASAPYGYSTCL